MASCTSRMSVSWRLSNASSIAILVGEVMPFIFKVAILIGVIRSNCGGEWARGRRSFLYFVLIMLRHSRYTPRPFPSYSSIFFPQFYLFVSGWCLPRIVSFMVFIRQCCLRRPRALRLRCPIRCTSDVGHHFLSDVFSLRVCMQVSRGLSGWPIVKCRHFCVHGYHFLLGQYSL